MENEIIIFSHSAGSLTARISCEIDHHTACRLRTRIDRELFAERPQVLRLDFGEVRFMDSSGIGLILGRKRLIESMGGGIYIKNTNPPIRKIISVAGLEALIISEKPKGRE